MRQLDRKAILAAGVLCILNASAATAQVVPLGNPPPAKTAHLSVRVYMAGSPIIRFGCRAIKLSVRDPSTTQWKVTTATSTESPTPSGKCAASFTVPANVPLALKAHAGHMDSRPAASAPASTGQWSNTFTLAPGETRSLGVEIFGTY